MDKKLKQQNARIARSLAPKRQGPRHVPSAVRPSPGMTLESRPLDLTHPHVPLDVPLGMTAQGPRWMTLSEGHVICGGATGTGVAIWLHAVVQALLDSGQAELYLYDGKRGKHFLRYRQFPRVNCVHTGALAATTGALLLEMARREEAFTQKGVVDLVGYNRAVTPSNVLRPLVLIVDELARARDEPGVIEDLILLAQLARESGIHLVLATQLPNAEIVPSQLRDNCLTRVAFKVPRREASVVLLGWSGAEQLPAVPGRLLALVNGTQIHAQAFTVELPELAASADPGSARPAEPRRRCK